MSEVIIRKLLIAMMDFSSKMLQITYLKQKENKRSVKKTM
jgi:hypothetical protein